MINLLLLLFSVSLTLADPMLYMFPTNPELHPAGMYPNHQFSRGKVRDLPDSGVIYLNRIKPIGDEFKGLVDMEKEPMIKKTKSMSKSTSSFERYNSEEERAPATARPTTQAPPPPPPPPPTSTISQTLPPVQPVEPEEIQFVSLTKPQKISEPKKSVQKTKLSVPEEAELDFLLEDLLKNKGLSKKNSGFPKIGRSASAKRHVGAMTPKLIGFDGTARVEPRRPRPVVVQHGIPTTQFRPRSSPVTVRLKPRKIYTTGTASKYPNHGPDFDPWERMGQ